MVGLEQATGRRPDPSGVARLQPYGMQTRQTGLSVAERRRRRTWQMPGCRLGAHDLTDNKRARESVAVRAWRWTINAPSFCAATSALARVAVVTNSPISNNRSHFGRLDKHNAVWTTEVLYPLADMKVFRFPFYVVPVAAPMGPGDPSLVKSFA
jgi:hypothetical protein